MTKINFWQQQITSNNTVDFTINGANAGIIIPSGTTAERPASAVDGTLRLNTTISEVEIYQLGAWQTLATNINVIGEVNTISSLGTGNSIFSAKVGTDLQLKSLKAGTNLTIGATGTELVFNADRIIDFPTIANIDTADSITIWDATLGAQTKVDIGTFFASIGGAVSTVDPTTITSFQSDTLWFGGVPYWWNGTTYAMDSAAANTLPLTGGTMSGNIVLANPVKILADANSSSLAPTYSFNNDTNSGFYRSAADTVNIVTGGTNAITVGPTQNTTFAQDVTVSGNLNVLGSTTTVSSANLAVTDNIIILNSGETGAGVTLGSGGLDIDRGTLTDATIIYNDVTDLWEIGLVGSTNAIWHAGYQGAGTGMDSDLLDGLEAVAFPLVANNLSDLTNAAAARTNLGLVAGGLGDIWVEKAGDTMTGNLLMNTGAQIQGDGSATLAVPAYAFDSDTTTGMYLAAANTLGLVASGTNIVTITAGIGTGSSVIFNTSDAIEIPSGTTAQRPSIPVNGMFRYNSTINKMEGYINGTWTGLDTGGLGLQIANNLSDLANVATARTNLGLVAGGTGDIWVEKAGDTMIGDLLLGAGIQIQGDASSTFAAPTYSFGANLTTGMYLAAANSIGFSTGGTNVITMQPGAGINSSMVVNTTDAIEIPAGTTAQRPSTPVNGMFRYNSTTGAMEGYINGAWTGLDAGGLGLQIANNLSDLASVPAARTNLGLVAGGLGDIWVEKAGDTMTGNLLMNTGAQIQGDGSATLAAPAYAFDTGLTTGMYLYGVDSIGFSAGGTNVIAMQSGAGVNASLVITSTDAVALPNGTTAQRPSTPVNGMMRYNSTTNLAEGYINGAWTGLDAGGLGLQIANNLSDLASAATARTNLGLVAAGAGDIWVEKAGDTMTGNLLMNTGAQIQGDGGAGSVAPAYAFDSDTTTGMYLGAANTIGFSSGGSNIVSITSGSGVGSSLTINTTDALTVPDGTTAQRPSTPTNGMIRHNTSLSQLEGYINGAWTGLDAGGLGLQIANNLSDLASAATARTNLGLVAAGAGDIWVEKAGDTMTGTLNMGNQTLMAPLDPTLGTHVGDRDYNDLRYMNVAGDTMTGSLNLGAGAQILTDAGTAALPAISFSSDPNSGFYSVGANSVGLALNGINVSTAQAGAGVNASFIFNTTDAIQLPSGTTLQQPSTPINGMIRYNSTTSAVETYAGGVWTSISGNLLSTNNLSDLASAATARTNLGLVAAGAGDIWVEKAGDTMTGTLNMGNQTLMAPLDPTLGTHVGDRAYNDLRYLTVAGGTMTGSIITGVGARILSDAGTAALPAISFSGDQNTGMYSVGADTLGLSVGGVNLVTAQTGGGNNASFVINATDAIQLPSGTTAQQPATPVNGMMRYNSTTTSIEAYTAGSWTSFGVGTGDLISTNNLSDLTNAATARTNLGLVAAGAGDIWVEKAGDTMTGNLLMNTGAQIQGDGAAGNAIPAYSFDTDPDSGLYRVGVNHLGISLGGLQRIDFKNQNGVDASFSVISTDAIAFPNGSTVQRPSTPVNGMMRYNSTTANFEGYINGAWSALGGSVVYTSATGTGDGTTSTFATGATNIQSVDYVEAFWDGVRQTPTSDYTLAGTSITFTTAPPSGVKIYMRTTTQT